MKRSFIIFLFFYLLGAAVSPVLADAGLSIEHSHWLVLGEDASTEGHKLNDWLQESPELDGDNHFLGTGQIRSQFSWPQLVLPSTKLQSTCFPTVAHRPLYLLFHAFIFYEKN